MGLTGYTWWFLSGHVVAPWWHIGGLSVVIGGLGTALLAWFFGKITPQWLSSLFHSDHRKIPNRVQDHIIELAAEHYSALSRNVSKSLKINDYGAVVSDDRARAILDFLDSIGVRPSAEQESLYVEFVLRVLAEMELEFSKIGFDPESAPQKGHDFEHWVVRELVRFGWQARATSGSGDQGVDVIAEKYGIRVGIQCKRYASPVGNKSVQEALSGKKFHGLDVAAVLTTSKYTRAARQLAKSADVVLMTHYDLPEADRFLLTRQRKMHD